MNKQISVVNEEFASKIRFIEMASDGYDLDVRDDLKGLVVIWFWHQVTQANTGANIVH
jgi:hypothetical protein